MQFPRRRRGEGHEPVIPLINIIFLLLIFFLVTGTLRSAELLEIDPPRALSGATSDPSLPAVLVDAEGRIAVDGVLVALADLGARVAERRGEAGGDHVIVKADGRVRAERLLEVMEALRRAGVSELSLITELQVEG